MPHFPVFANFESSEAARFLKLFCIVSINLLYFGLLRPAARIMSGEMSITLSVAPNVARRVVDLTQSSMSSERVQQGIH